MKRKFSYVILILMALWGCTSCVFSYVATPAPVNLDVKPVTFTLVMSQNGSTKADDNTWGDGDWDSLKGTVFENRIFLNDLRVFVFDPDGTMTELKQLAFTTQNGIDFTFKGVLDRLVDGFKLEVGAEYRFMVLANCGLTDIREKPSSIGTLSYENPMTFYQGSAIPMWGVTSATLEAESNIEPQNLGDIHMLRSLAKIEVLLADEILYDETVNPFGYKLRNVTINRVNPLGYCVPTGWNSIANTTLLTHDDSFNEYESSAAAVPQDVTFISTVENKKMILYVPECGNLVDDELALDIQLEQTVIKGDETQNISFEFSKAILFREDADDPKSAMHNIVRNHQYRYIINKVEAVSVYYDVVETAMNEVNIPTFE